MEQEKRTASRLEKRSVRRDYLPSPAMLIGIDWNLLEWSEENIVIDDDEEADSFSEGNNSDSVPLPMENI